MGSSDIKEQRKPEAIWSEYMNSIYASATPPKVSSDFEKLVEKAREVTKGNECTCRALAFSSQPSELYFVLSANPLLACRRGVHLYQRLTSVGRRVSINSHLLSSILLSEPMPDDR